MLEKKEGDFSQSHVITWLYRRREKRADGRTDVTHPQKPAKRKKDFFKATSTDAYCRFGRSWVDLYSFVLIFIFLQSWIVGWRRALIKISAWCFMRKCATLFECGVQKWNVVGFLVCGFSPSFSFFHLLFGGIDPSPIEGSRWGIYSTFFCPPRSSVWEEVSPPLMKRCHEKEKKKLRLFLPRACCVFDSLRGQFCESFFFLSLSPLPHLAAPLNLCRDTRNASVSFVRKMKPRGPHPRPMQKLFSPLFWGFPSLRCHLLTSPKSINSPRGKGQRGKGEGGGGGEAINAVASKLLLLLWCQTDTSLYTTAKKTRGNGATTELEKKATVSSLLLLGFFRCSICLIPFAHIPPIPGSLPQYKLPPNGFSDLLSLFSLPSHAGSFLRGKDMGC